MHDILARLQSARETISAMSEQHEGEGEVEGESTEFVRDHDERTIWGHTPEELRQKLTTHPGAASGGEHLMAEAIVHTHL
jgi:hypothetical protein